MWELLLYLYRCCILNSEILYNAKKEKNMENELFRKKRIEKISSPDQLTDYICVTNPGVFMVLAAIVILLAGTCIWGVYGRLETKLQVAAVCDGEVIICYIPEANISSVALGMSIVIDDVEYPISAVAEEPVMMTADYGDYLLHLGGLQAGEWIYKVSSECVTDAGIYSAYIVTDSVSPLSFVFN